MEITPLSIAGAYVITPRQFPDGRGVFESFRGDKLAEQPRAPTGHRPDQRFGLPRGTVRGIHFCRRPAESGEIHHLPLRRPVDYIIDTSGRFPDLRPVGVGAPRHGRPQGRLSARKAWGMPSARSRTTQRRCTRDRDLQPDRRAQAYIRWTRTIGLTLGGIEPFSPRRIRRHPHSPRRSTPASSPTWEQCQSYAAELASR